MLVLLHCGCSELEIFCCHLVCNLVHDIGGVLAVELDVVQFQYLVYVVLICTGYLSVRLQSLGRLFPICIYF